MKRSVSALLLVAFVALAVAVPVALAKGDMKIALRSGKAYPQAKGSAQYQAQTSQRELQVEVEHIRSLQGKHVLFYVNGAKIGAARVSSLGKAELSRNTERGQRVPQVKSGTKVMVRTSGAVMVVSGSF
jgi:predicted PilT family ATPase